MVLVVEMEDQSPQEKPFLGGWRNTITGLVYHNACTQTLLTLRKERNACIAVTQTVDVVDNSTNVAYDKATQVHSLPDLGDTTLEATFRKIIHPNDSQISSGKDFEDYVIKIQRYYRAYREKVLIDRFLDLDSETNEEKGEEITALLDGQTNFTLLNSMQVETKRDFQLLRNMLDRWRTLEHERANRLLFRPSKVAACGVILSKEVKILRALDSMKTAIKSRQKEKERRRFLDDLSRPTRGKNYRGDWITVYTPRVQKAQDLRRKYELLCEDGPVVSDRMKFLAELKKEAGLHCCARSSELSHLIDQEMCLLSHDVEPAYLGQLRSRLKLSFLRLARSILDVGSRKDDFPRLLDATKLCESCGRVLALPKFSRDKRLRVSTCRYCASLQTFGGRGEFLYEPYERMLRELQLSESKMGCREGLAFVMGPSEIRQLVHSIWRDKSPLSECDDLEFLRLVRLRRDVQWAPWNCILLAKPEAAVHRLVQNLQHFYGPHLLQLFKTKNLQAKFCFSDLVNLQERQKNSQKD